jgi:hypothetical protein
VTAFVIWVIGAMFTDAYTEGYPWYQIWLTWPWVLGNWFRIRRDL